MGPKAHCFMSVAARRLARLLATVTLPEKLSSALDNLVLFPQRAGCRPTHLRGRTTPNVLALQDDEIFFGDIAVSLQQRVNTSYVHTKQLLGRRADETGPKDTDPSGGPPWFQAMGLRYDIVPDQRGTVRLPDGKRCEPDRAIVVDSTT